MENDPEMIRQQMDQTRSALTEKLERLEQQVVGTVQGATSAVNETVGNVREAVHETVGSVRDTVHETVRSVTESVHGTMESVKDAFDLERQVQARPWAMMAGAVGLGFVGGYLLRRTEGYPSDYMTERMSLAGHWRESEDQQRELGNGRLEGAEERRAVDESERAGRERTGILRHVGETFEKEISQLKGLAIGAMLGIVRDMAADAMPETIGPQVQDVINSVTQKLGGQPLRGRLLPAKDGAPHSSEEFSYSASGDHPPRA